MNRFKIPVRYISQRRVLLAVLWYSLVISILGIYYTHVQTKDRNLLLRVSNSVQLTHSVFPPLRNANSISREQTKYLGTVMPQNNVSMANFSRLKQNNFILNKDAVPSNHDSLNIMDVRNVPGYTGINWFEIDKAIDWETLKKDEFKRIKKQLNNSLLPTTEKPGYSQKKYSNISYRKETNLSAKIKKDFFQQFNLFQPKKNSSAMRYKNSTNTSESIHRSSSFIKNVGKSKKKSSKFNLKGKGLRDIYNITKVASKYRKTTNKLALKKRTTVQSSNLTKIDLKPSKSVNALLKHTKKERTKQEIEAERERNISRELMKKELALMKLNTLSPKAVAKRADGYFKVATSKNLHLHCNWCAVISSSGQLLNQSAGKEIDQFPCVIRMNTSPTKGYENDVGSKTTVRVIGHVNLLKINESVSLQDELFVDKITAAEKNIIPWLYNVRVNKKTDKFYKVVKNFSSTFHDTEFYLLSGSKMRNAEHIFKSEIGISRREARTWLSTGWMTMLFALDICEKIHVYGLVPENYCDGRVNDSTPYHYYESDGLHECDYYKTSEEQLRYGHLFVTEKAVFGRWAVKHNISFHYPSWNLSGIDASKPLDTPFIKMYRAAKLNETLMQELNKTNSEIKKVPIGLSLRKHVKYHKTSSKYSQFSSAMILIMAVFLSMVAFLLLFLFLSLLLLCFYV